MVFISLIILFAPGLIALRIHWHGRGIKRQDLKFLICDYLIFNFVVAIAESFFLFLTHPHDGVHFLTESNSFLFKWSVIALFMAVVSPLAVKHRALFFAWVKSVLDIGSGSEQSGYGPLSKRGTRQIIDMDKPLR